MEKFIFNLWSLITSSCLAHCSVDCNRPDQLPFLPELSGHLNRVLKCDVIILQNSKAHHVIHTAAVKTYTKFQIVSIMKVKIERFEVLHGPNY